jgi:putative transposase
LSLEDKNPGEPPASCLAKQQIAFDGFRPEYNEELPNEALGMETPAALYRPSRRAFPEKLSSVEYESWFTVRRVRSNGCIKWRGGFVYVSANPGGGTSRLKTNR